VGRPDWHGRCGPRTHLGQEKRNVRRNDLQRQMARPFRLGDERTCAWNVAWHRLADVRRRRPVPGLHVALFLFVPTATIIRAPCEERLQWLDACQQYRETAGLLTHLFRFLQAHRLVWVRLLTAINGSVFRSSDCNSSENRETNR
jgi:hypothetical protein